MRARALPAPAPWRLWLTANLPPKIAGSRLSLSLSLGLVMAAVAALEYSPFGEALQAGLASLEFDPTRAAMIAAWTFCGLGALLAGALTARPWPSALAATGYMCLTHTAAGAWDMVTVGPVLFGSPERLNALAMVHNVSTVVRFILVAGESDAHNLRRAEAFAAELDQLRVPHALFRLPGGHESWVWTNGLALGLVELKPQLGEHGR